MIPVGSGGIVIAFGWRFVAWKGPVGVVGEDEKMDPLKSAFALGAEATLRKKRVAGEPD